MTPTATLQFRLATPADTQIICQIIAQAQAQMRALGSEQWQDGYPSAADIDIDIALSNGWVMTDQQGVTAYGAVLFSGEPAYENLRGEWLTQDNYVVVHRLAVADRAKRRGVASEFMLRVQTLAHQRGIHSFRIDTSFDNHYMLRIIERLGFTECGRVSYRSGERIAFEKIGSM